METSSLVLWYVFLKVNNGAKASGARGFANYQLVFSNKRGAQERGSISDELLLYSSLTCMYAFLSRA